jgi:hypothetical protein
VGFVQLLYVSVLLGSFQLRLGQEKLPVQIPCALLQHLHAYVLAAQPMQQSLVGPLVSLCFNCVMLASLKHA